MTDFIQGLLERARGEASVIQPVVPGLYELGTASGPVDPAMDRERDGEERPEAKAPDRKPVEPSMPVPPQGEMPVPRPAHRDDGARTSASEVRGPAAAPPEPAPTLAPAAPLPPTPSTRAPHSDARPEPVRAIPDREATPSLHASGPLVTPRASTPTLAPVAAPAVVREVVRANDPTSGAADDSRSSRRSRPDAGARVDVHIGRVEIRSAGSTPAARPEERVRAPRRTAASLADVLSRARGGA